MSFATAAKIAAGAIVGVQALLYAGRGDDPTYIRPPGYQGESDFLSHCIRCGKCQQACPYQSIFMVNDIASTASGTPSFNMRIRACQLCETFPCVEACPTDALRDVEVREDVMMGTAVINEDTCIALQGMRCEVCYRVCPLIDKAITIDYRLREGDAIHTVFAPIIHEEACVGCGLCVERCVVEDPAITIRRA